MNKNILAAFGGVAVGLAIFLPKVFLRDPVWSADPSLSLTEDSSNVAVSNADMHESRGKISHSVLGFRSFSSATTNLAKQLTKEEADWVEEALDLSAPMQAYLDDDNETNALKEARNLATHSRPEVRRAALEAMRWIGPDAASDIPLFFSDDDDAISQLAEEVFWEVIEEIENPILQIKLFATSLESSSPQLRFDALERMIYLPDALSFPAMAPLLGDPNEEVRDLARENLEFIAEEEFSSEAEAMDWFARNKTDIEGF